MPRPGLRFSVVLILLTTSHRPVEAQRSAAPRSRQDDTAVEAEYSSHVDRALKEYARGNWPEAKVFFTRAHALRPSARTLRGLGLTSYEMRSYVEACDYLRLALDSRERPLTDEMRKTVETALGEAMSFVARYRVVLEPPNANLEVDDRVPVLREDALWLDPGTHVLSVRAEGYKPASRTLAVHGGERAELRVVLERQQGATIATADRPAPEPAPTAASSVEITPLPSQPVAEASQAEPSHWNTQRIVGLGLGIGGVVAAAIGSTYGVLAVNEKSATNGGCTAAGCVDEESKRHNDAALARARVSTISFVTAGVLLAAGTVVYFTASSETEAPQHALRLQPELGLSNAGLSLAGRW